MQNECGKVDLLEQKNEIAQIFLTLCLSWFIYRDEYRLIRIKLVLHYKGFNGFVQKFIRYQMSDICYCIEQRIFFIIISYLNKTYKTMKQNRRKCTVVYVCLYNNCQFGSFLSNVSHLWGKNCALSHCTYNNNNNRLLYSAKPSHFLANQSATPVKKALLKKNVLSHFLNSLRFNLMSRMSSGRLFQQYGAASASWNPCF